MSEGTAALISMTSDRIMFAALGFAVGWLWRALRTQAGKDGCA